MRHPSLARTCQGRIENLGSLAVTLDARDLARIAEVMPPDAAAGLRDPEAMLSFVNQ